MNGTPQRSADTPLLERLAVLVGEWDFEVSVEGRPTVRGRAVFEPFEDGAYLIMRADTVPSDIEVPAVWVANSPFPTVVVIGLDTVSETFAYLYTDARGVHRNYQMIFADGVWTIRGRPADQFHQRFVGTVGGDTISAYWERSPDGERWERDFDLTYTKVT